MKNILAQKRITEDLGFPLTVVIEVGDFEISGRHRTYETEYGEVPKEQTHTIQLQRDLALDYLFEVITHEVYHLFYSLRPHIKVDEETETTVYGQLVRHAYNVYLEDIAND